MAFAARFPSGLPALARCRRVSNRHMPALTETFRFSTLPSMGMETRRSHVSRVSRRMPFPSAPSTQAIGSIEPDGIKIAVRIGGCPDYRYAAQFQFPQRASEIGDGNIWHRIGGTTRYFMHRGGEPNGTILGRDHGMNAKSIRYSQACTQIMRVLYSVQYQKQALAQ